MYKIYKKIGTDLYDFTDFCGAITLRSSLDEISEELDFTISGKFLSESHIVIMYSDTTKIFEGVVISTEKDQYTTAVKAFDFGWYLNKNEEVYQFNNSVSDCIKKICNQFAIPVGSIINIPIQYKKIIRGTLSDTIKELLAFAKMMSGKRYIYHMRDGKFYVELQSNAVVTYNTSAFENLIDITKLFDNTTIRRSIENMVNSVKVTQDIDNNVKVLSSKEDAENIKKFGMLQKLESLSKEDSPNAKNVASSTLLDLNKTEESFTITLPGVIACRAGKVLHFDDDIIPISGSYRVKQCSHQITSTSHLMELEMEVLNG